MSGNSETIITLLDSIGLTAWGVADLSILGEAAPRGYGSALVMISELFPEGEPPTLESYEEQSYHSAELEAGRVLEGAAGELCALLGSLGILNVRISGQDEESLSSCFQQKTAATLAGLGWIGKNGMLVSPGFGPRLEMATVLAAEGPRPGKPVTRSRCGKCRLCVEACPSRALKGGTWSPGCGRSGLIDAFECDRWRRSHIPVLGRKHACAMCAVVCPVGRQTLHRHRAGKRHPSLSLRAQPYYYYSDDLRKRT